MTTPIGNSPSLAHAALHEPGGVADLSPFYDLAGAADAVPTYVIATFSYQGTIATLTGASRFYPWQACTILGVRASVGTAPVGQSIIVDVLKTGSTVYTTTSHRPTILVSTNTALGGALSTTSMTGTDYLTVNIIQVGTTTIGADLTVQVYLEPTA